MFNCSAAVIVFSDKMCTVLSNSQIIVSVITYKGFGGSSLLLVQVGMHLVFDILMLKTIKVKVTQFFKSRVLVLNTCIHFKFVETLKVAYQML